MNHFKTKEEAEKWQNSLPINDFMFFANLNCEIYEQNFGSENDSRFEDFKRGQEVKIALIRSTHDKEKTSLAEDVKDKSDQIESLNSQLIKAYDEKRNEVDEARKEEKQKYGEEERILRLRILELETQQKELVETRIKDKVDILIQKHKLDLEKALFDKEKEKSDADKEVQFWKNDVAKKDERIQQLETEQKEIWADVIANLKRAEKSVGKFDLKIRLIQIHILKGQIFRRIRKFTYGLLVAFHLCLCFLS